MSSTSTDVNANVNPVYADVIKVDLVDNSDDPEMVKDWRNWTLQGIVRILRDMAKPEKCYGMAAVQWETLFSISFWKQRRIRMFFSR